MPTTAAAISSSVRRSDAVIVNGIDRPVTRLSMRYFSGHGCARSASVIRTVDAAAPPSAPQWRRTISRISRFAPPAPGWVRSSSSAGVEFAVRRRSIEQSLPGRERLARRGYVIFPRANRCAVRRPARGPRRRGPRARPRPAARRRRRGRGRRRTRRSTARRRASAGRRAAVADVLDQGGAAGLERLDARHRRRVHPGVTAGPGHRRAECPGGPRGAARRTPNRPDPHHRDAWQPDGRRVLPLGL